MFSALLKTSLLCPLKWNKVIRELYIWKTVDNLSYWSVIYKCWLPPLPPWAVCLDYWKLAFIKQPWWEPIFFLCRCILVICVYQHFTHILIFSVCEWGPCADSFFP
jgi:hypothetical protein